MKDNMPLQLDEVDDYFSGLSNEDLLKGLQKHMELCELINKIISSAGGTWDSVDWWDAKILEDLNSTIGNLLQHIPEELQQNLQQELQHMPAEKEILTAIAKKAKEIGYPIDKVNYTIWDNLSEDLNGQLAIPIKAESSIDERKGKEINIYYTIQFEEIEGLKITKALDAYDKRVYIAIGALFNAGNEVVTLNQIYYAMGNTSKPSKTQLDKINGAVTKMRNATIYLDNGEEIEANYKYPRFKYDGALLPIERITATINGQTTETAIRIFREPPVISFAKKRKQVTTLNAKLLQSPINKTDSNLKIEDYLLYRISRAKNAANKTKKKTEKILYKAIYEHCNFTNRMQKSRVPETLRRYLDYYKDVKYITGYNMKDTDSITITL